MRAAVLHAFGRPLRIEERPDPEPGSGEVIVEVKAIGLCATDLKITSGAFADTPLPIVPGHEIAGVVAATGTGVEALELGRRVACHVYDACGACPRCRAGQETLCPNSKRIGVDLDGGLARYVRMKARNVFPFPNSVPFESAAIAMDAVLSTWRALQVRAGLKEGERLVIAGAGGLGLNAIQVARALGATVAVLDPAADHRRAAEAAGAELAVGPDEWQQVLEWSHGGADVGLEASGRREGFDAALSSLRPGARLVCNGYWPGVEYGLDSKALVLNEITLLGSRNGSRADARAALDAVGRGLVKPLVMEHVSLDEVNSGLELLRTGAVLGRIVVHP
jgi:propanol-preferring alcohol dehydrogenase